MPFQVEHQVDLPTNTLLRAKLKSLEVVSRSFTDRKTGELNEFQKLQWLFEITEQGEYALMTVRAETSAYFSDSPDNVNRAWAEALLGRPLDQGVVINESDLVGLSALITVRYEDDRKDPKKKWRRIDDVIPLNVSSTVEPPF